MRLAAACAGDPCGLNREPDAQTHQCAKEDRVAARPTSLRWLLLHGERQHRRSQASAVLSLNHLCGRWPKHGSTRPSSRPSSGNRSCPNARVGIAKPEMSSAASIVPMSSSTLRNAQPGAGTAHLSSDASFASAPERQILGRRSNLTRPGRARMVCPDLGQYASASSLSDAAKDARAG